MSQETDAHACGPESHNHGDSAGVPWEGRSFESNPHASDDGSADPALLAALLRFRAGEGSQVDVVDAFRTARVLIPSSLRRVRRVWRRAVSPSTRRRNCPS